MAVELRPVTKENWRELAKLNVKEDQRNFVATNVYSIAQAQFGIDHEGHWDFYPFGIYAEGQAVGFTMYGLNLGHARQQAFVIRLMVDERFQGQGHGRAAMNILLDRFRAEAKIAAVGISYEPENEAARKLYASLGFVEPGEMIDDETLAILQLRQLL
jgi:diamine N-acetyltransferase